jgi:hypothetical protein
MNQRRATWSGEVAMSVAIKARITLPFIAFHYWPVKATSEAKKIRSVTLPICRRWLRINNRTEVGNPYTPFVLKSTSLGRQIQLKFELTLREKGLFKMRSHKEWRRADHASRITESSETYGRAHLWLVYMRDAQRQSVSLIWFSPGPLCH